MWPHGVVPAPRGTSESPGQSVRDTDARPSRSLRPLRVPRLPWSPEGHRPCVPTLGLPPFQPLLPICFPLSLAGSSVPWTGSWGRWLSSRPCRCCLAAFVPGLGAGQLPDHTRFSLTGCGLQAGTHNPVLRGRPELAESLAWCLLNVLEPRGGHAYNGQLVPENAWASGSGLARPRAGGPG